MVATSVLFSFKTILVVYAGWLPVITAISALPLLFSTAAMAFERPSLKSAAALGGAGTLALHAGHLQLTYYALLFIAVWATLTVVRRLSVGERRFAARLSSVLTLAALVAIGLSAYLLLPITTDVGLSTRGAATYEFFLGRTPGYGLHLLTFFNPELYGTPLDGSFVEAWEYIAFVGGVTSIFAFVGAMKGRDRPLSQVLLWGLAISALLSLNTPLLALVFKVVPGYSIFRLPARMLFLSAFFVCCLAGIGLDRVLSREATSARRAIVAVLAIGFVALEGSFWAYRYLATPESISPAIRAEYTTALTSIDIPFRVASLSPSTPDAGSASALGLQLVTGYDPFVMRHYQTYIDLVQHNRVFDARPGVWTILDAIGRSDMLDVLNVLYVVSPKPANLQAEQYTLVQSFDAQPQFRFYDGMATGPVYLYKNSRFLPRAFFVSNVVAAEDDASVVAAIQQTDVRETAVVARPVPAGKSTPNASDKVEIIRSAAGTLDIAARNVEPRFLLVSEVWHPGWSAQVDGQAATLVRTDIALLGLWLQPGEHQIQIRFWPPGLTVGLTITGITIAGVLCLLLGIAVRTRSAAGRA
jgi:hypothetical protein